MMIRWLVAAIETHEGADQRTVGQAQHVGGNEPQRVYVPAHAHIEVGRLKYEMSEFGDLGRLQRRALGVVHSNDLVRRVMGDWRANLQRLVRHEAMHDVDGHAFGIAQMDDGASTRSIRRDNWTTGGLRQLLEVLLRPNRQSKSEESSFRTDRDAIDVGLRPCSSHEQLAFAFRDNGQAEVKQVLLGFADIRTLKMNK